MSAAFDVKISGALISRLPEITDPVKLLTGLAKAMAEQNNLTVTHIVDAYASFPQDEPTTMAGLRTISGHLRQNYIASAPEISGTQLISGIGNNLVYAKIQEFGGQTRAHDIVAKPGKALAFNPGTGQFFVAEDFRQATAGTRGNTKKAAASYFAEENGIIFRKRVHHPGSDIPARQPVQRGIEDRLDEYAAAFGNVITWMLPKN